MCSIVQILKVFIILGNHKLQAAIVGAVCLSVYLVFAYLTYLVTNDIVQLVFHDDNFNSVIVQSTLMLLLIQHVFYLLLTWPESLSVNSHLVQWKHFQVLLDIGLLIIISPFILVLPTNSSHKSKGISTHILWGICNKIL